MLRVAYSLCLCQTCFFSGERSDVPQGKISLSTEHVHLDTHWETAAGDTTYPGFAAASLMTYKGLESSTNDSFQGLSAEHKGTKFSMNSKVVTVSVSNENTGHLQKPVTLTFSHLQGTEENRSHSCVYWDGAAGAGLSGADAFHLEVITWVGLSVSQVCLLLCIVTFFCCRSIQGTRNTIHLHLCICLFIANLVFPRRHLQHTEQGVLAVRLWPVSFTSSSWRCSAGCVWRVQLYRMVVLVFNTTLHPRCMTAAGYGIPAIIVAISLLADSKAGINLEFLWSCLHHHHVWKLAEKFSSLNPDFSNLRKIKTFTVTAVVQLCVLGNMWIFGYFLFEKAIAPWSAFSLSSTAYRGAAVPDALPALQTGERRVWQVPVPPLYVSEEIL
ncbi:hypothetical protein ANANG_G00318880 [Anguilla anguilla]|uniref:Uncharacterized protein n=1 Tax=Anguilla anguilla TaxID=7936 RepID=A0A9D3LKY2_ANGAN|nr:hypothetical protein ANANG_G00318880 [Anguilla anguilla]